MAQFSQATLDVLTGGWTNQDATASSIFTSIDEPTYDEADFIRSTNNPDLDEVYFASLGPDPSAPVGSIATFSYVYAKSAAAGRGVDFGVRALSGATILSVGTHTGVSESTTQSSITWDKDDFTIDYSDLSFSVAAQDTGGGPGRRGYFYWARLELDDAGAAPSSATTRQLQDTSTFADQIDTADYFTRTLQDDNSVTTFERLRIYKTQVVQSVATGSAQLSDQIQQDGLFTREPQDVNVLADQIQTTDVFGRELQDEFTFADQHSVTTTGAGEGPSSSSATISDSFAFADQIQTADEFGRDLQDPFSFTDQIRTADVLDRELQDQSTFADQVQRRLIHGEQLQDSFVLSDQIRTADHFTRLLQDQFTFADNLVSDVVIPPQVLQDEFTFTDQIQTADVLDRELQDSFVLSDQIQTADVFTRQIQDQFTFADNLVGEVEVPPSVLQDTFTFTDQIRTADEFGRNIQDDLTFEDNLDYTLVDADAVTVLLARIIIHKISEEIPN